MSSNIPCVIFPLLFSFILFLMISTGDSHRRLEKKHMFEEDAHAKEHIQEDLKHEGVKDPEQMSDEEYSLHYFKLHDYDENMQLDGLELLQAFTHLMEHQGSNTENPDLENFVLSYSAMIDGVLEKSDLNRDGMLNYVEYKLAQRSYQADDVTS